jgi:type I restriction enzyme S subunit
LLMEDLGPLARAVGELIILRFNNKVCPEFVCVYLNLGPVRLAVQRLTRGNTAHLYPDDLSALPIPLLPSEFQQRIADLVTQSWEARQKARQLLEEAKKMVENLIEGKA